MPPELACVQKDWIDIAKGFHPNDPIIFNLEVIVCVVLYIITLTLLWVNLLLTINLLRYCPRCSKYCLFGSAGILRSPMNGDVMWCFIIVLHVHQKPMYAYELTCVALIWTGILVQYIAYSLRGCDFSYLLILQEKLINQSVNQQPVDSLNASTSSSSTTMLADMEQLLITNLVCLCLSVLIPLAWKQPCIHVLVL